MPNHKAFDSMRFRAMGLHKRMVAAWFFGVLLGPSTVLAAAYTVTTLGDTTGSCAGTNCTTLRAAITSANATAGVADSIGFSASGTINIMSVLPQITDTLVINGNGITLNGGGGGYSALQFSGAGASNSQLRNISITNFNQVGVPVSNAANIVINNNTIGMLADDGWDAVRCLNSDNCSITNNTVIDGFYGISVFNSSVIAGYNAVVTGNHVSGTNYGIGLSSIDNVAVSNNVISNVNFVGIRLVPQYDNSSTSNNTITNNTISGSGSNGISFELAGGQVLVNTMNNNVIHDNTITNNRGAGINLGSGAALQINNATITTNTITGNTRASVIITGTNAANNAVYANTNISGNGGLGIDLGLTNADGVTQNHAGGIATGPNGFQNFPITTGVVGNTVSFTLDVPTNANGYRVDFYNNTGGLDPTGYGEGQTWLSSCIVASPSATIPSSCTVAGADATTLRMTATKCQNASCVETATSSIGATSEFNGASNAQLTVGKSATPNPFVVGQPASYAITVTNSGGTPTSAPITIADTLPAGITLATSSGTNWLCTGSPALSCTYSGTLAAGASTTLTLNVNVVAGATNGDNTATASGGGDPSCPAAAHCVGHVAVPISGFSCSVSTIFVGQGSPTQLNAEIYGAGGAVFNPIGPVSAWVYNAIAYRQADNFIYAISQTLDAGHPAGHLLRIDPATGVPVDLGAISGPLASGANIGAFDASDNYYIATSTDSAIYRLNLTTRVETPTALTPSQAISISDFTYANGFFWGVSNSAQTITRIDPTSGAIARFATTLVPADTYGAAWTFGNGNLGFSNNTTGRVYQIAVANPAATPTFMLVSSSTGPGSTNNDGTSCVAPPVDLGIAKTGPAIAAAGGALSWTLTVTNNGPGSSSGFTVSDVVPAGVTGVASPTAGCTVAGNTVTCVEGALANGAMFAITITGNAPVPFPTAITNTANVTGNEQDPVLANNSASETVQPAPQLTVTKTATPNPFVLGQAAQYAIVVQNTGVNPTTAPITIADTLPAGLTFVNATGTNWTCTGGPALSCTFSGTLAPTASTTLTLNVTVGAGTTSANNSATASGGGDPTCPVAAHCTGAVTVPVSAIADLAITKTDGSATYTAGNSITYTIVASNAGPSPAIGAIVADTIPATITGATWACVGAGGATCPPAGSGNINASVNVPVGGSATFTVTGTVSASATGNLVNTATITPPAGTTDPTPGNNSATDTDTAAASADLSITKTDGSTTYTPGSAITYTIVASNAGPSTAIGAIVADTIPATITGATWTAVYTAGASGPPNGSGNINATVTIPSGGHATFTLIGTVSASATGNLVNTATVSTPAGTTDPNPANNSATDTDTQGPQLTVVKSATPNPFVVGQPASYAITVTNSGGTPTSAPITIADTLPAGITLASATGTNWICTGPPALSCTFSGTLAAGATTTLTLNVDVAASAANGNNTASASGGGDPSCPTATHCTGTVVVPITPAADIAVLKTVDNATPNVGEQITFTITATNNGPSDATGVQITDALPSGLVFVSAAPSQGSFDNTTGLWSVGALTNGTSATLEITATVIATGTLTNTAMRTGGDQLDPNPSNNAASASVNAQPSADIQVLKTVDNATPNVGSEVTFTITATNGGPDDATGVALTDVLPPGLSFTLATPSQGTFDEASGEWTVGALANGASVTLTITAIVTQTGDLTNIASVSHSDQFDPNPANNSAGVTINGQSADIQIIKTVDNANPTVGDTITFTIVTTNNGPSAATGVEVTETLPSQLTLVSATPSAGTYDNATGVWTIGDLDATGAGATVTLTIVATVNTDGAFANTVTVTGSDQPDPNPANNTSTVPILGNGSADLVVVKTGPANATPGTNVAYTLTVTNNGPSTAVAASLDDPTPAGLTFVSATAPCAGNFPCPLGDLASGASVTVTVTFSLPADYTGPLSNTATTTSTTGDPDPSNNSSTVTTPLTPTADIVVAKTGPATVSAAGAISYSVVVTNNGPSEADGTLFSDPVPAAISGVTALCGGETAGAVCGAVDVTGNNVSSTITTLPSGASVTFTINGTAPADAGTLSNTASAQPPAGTTDPDPSNNTSTVDTDVGAVANIAVVKSGPATVMADGAISYSIVVSNAGPSSADGTLFSDPVPAGISGVTASCAPSSGGAVCGTVNVAGNTVTSTITALPSGGSVTFTINGTAPANATALSNTASVTPPTGTTDPDPSDNTSTVGTTVTPIADLVVAKTGPATITAGGTITYTIIASNAGPSDVSGALFSDPVPAGIAGVTATCAATIGGAVCGAVGVAGNNVTSTITMLPAGGSVTFTISGIAPANATTLTNTATIAPPAGVTDPNLANNVSSANTTVNASADLAIVKSGPATITSGAMISYTLLISNAGPSAADNASYSDSVPAGITGVTALCGAPTGGATCATPNVAGNTVSGTVPVFPSGGAVTITVSGNAPFGTQTLNNTATVTPPTGTTDPNPANNSSSVSTTIGGAADIALAKTVDNDVPNVGDSVTFTVTATNNGPNDATGVAVTDSLPAGLGFVSATPSTGTYDSASGLWTIGNLANGASATLTLTATVDQPGTLTNTVAVSASDQPDPNPSNNTAGAALNAGASADIALAKTVDNPLPNVGTQVTYTISATNNGPDDATGVEATDHLPAGVSFVSATPSQGSYDSASGVWTIGALANGAIATLTITVDVEQPGPIMNSVAVTHEDQFDPVGANNQAGVTINGQEADLAVTKTVDNPTPDVGGNVTFTVTVHNNGPSDATDVALTDHLPAGLAFVSATPSQGSYDEASGIWNVGTLTAAGATSTATLSVVATVTQAGALTNTASVSASDQPDPNPANNSASASLNGNPQADLAIGKSGPATVTPGDDIAYTIVVTNNGPSDASNVVITDPTPAGLTFVSNAGACTSAYPCTIASLASGASVTITTTDSVPADYAGANPIVNTASVTSDTPDPNTTNNQSSASTNVGAGNADLAIVKNGPATVASGDAISYTLTITNNGPSPANGASYSDTVPASITAISASCGGESGGAACATQPVVAGNSVSGTVGSLPSGGSVVITINGTAPNGPLTLNNTATVAPPAGVDDPDPSNNSSSVSTHVGAPSADLSVVKTGPASLTPGTDVTYVLTISNAGPDTAVAAMLADPTPAGLTFVSASTPCQIGFPCALGDIVAGGSTIVTVTFAVAADASGSITNVGTVSSSTPDPDPSNNASTVTIPVVPVATSADLAVVKTGPATTTPGGNVTYSLQVTNNGPDAATNVMLSDPAPAGLSFVSADAPCNAGFPCPLGTLASGASTTVTVTVTFAVAANASGSIANTAVVGSDTPDPNGSNNSSTATTTIIPVSVVSADLAVSKTGPASANAGATVAYTIGITNNGPDAVPDAVLTDPTPPGLSFVSASAPCTAGFPCALGALANGASTSVSVTYTVDAGYAGTIVNTAHVSSATVPDPTPANNASAATTTVSGTGPPAPVTQVPIDARWMLLLMALSLILVGAPLARRRR